MIDYPKMFGLGGKKAAVFGGGGLLGAQISTALAQAGARVSILDIRGSKGSDTASALRGKGLDAGFEHLNVAETRMLEKRINTLWNRRGPFHVVVNSSYPRTKDWAARCEDVKLESWNRNLESQLASAFLISRAFAELMKKNGIQGSIVNMASIYGVVGNDFTVYEGTGMTSPVAYSAIKGGAVNMTRYLASYYGADGIRFNALCPGGIFDGQDKRFVRQYSKKVPLRRMGRPEEVASCALFLASEASSYITGTAFMVDGGWTAV